jgi:hypothetical protein
LGENYVATIFIERTSLMAVDKALYSASMVEVAMSVCNLLTHKAGKAAIALYLVFN